MSEREAVKEWLIADCLSCGKPFGQESAWMNNCPICFKEKNGYKLLKGDLAFACLQEEVDRLRCVPPVKPPEDGTEARLREENGELVKELMQLHARVEKLHTARGKLRIRVRELEGEVARLEAQSAAEAPAATTGSAPAIDLPLLRKMLHLCHPDKNPNNIELATEVTQWLLQHKSKTHR